MEKKKKKKRKRRLLVILLHLERQIRDSLIVVLLGEIEGRSRDARAGKHQNNPRRRRHCPRDIQKPAFEKVLIVIEQKRLNDQLRQQNASQSGQYSACQSAQIPPQPQPS